MAAVRPFAVESYGRLGAEALAVLREARQRVAERIGERAFASSGIVGRWLALPQCQLLLAQLEAAVTMVGASVVPFCLASASFR